MDGRFSCQNQILRFNHPGKGLFQSLNLWNTRLLDIFVCLTRNWRKTKKDGEGRITLYLVFLHIALFPIPCTHQPDYTAVLYPIFVLHFAILLLYFFIFFLSLITLHFHLSICYFCLSEIYLFIYLTLFLYITLFYNIYFTELKLSANINFV